MHSTVIPCLADLVLSLIHAFVGFLSRPLHNLQVSRDRRLFLVALIASASDILKVVLGAADTIFSVDDAFFLDRAKLLLLVSFLILFDRLLVFAKERLNSLSLTIGLA